MARFNLDKDREALGIVSDYIYEHLDKTDRISDRVIPSTYRLGF